jgi:hypothetical protein
VIGNKKGGNSIEAGRCKEIWVGTQDEDEVYKEEGGEKKGVEETLAKQQRQGGGDGREI